MQDISKKYNNIAQDRKTIMLNNFLGGIAWGIGSVIGATVIIATLSFIFVQTRYIPFIGNMIDIVQQELEKADRSNLLQ